MAENIEEIAGKLSVSQRAAILRAHFDRGRNMYCPAGRPTTFQCLGKLGLVSWDHGVGSYLSPLGLAVRAHIQKDPPK